MTPGLIVETTRKWLGTPYHHQASIRGAGCDCLGLVRGVFFDLYGLHPEEPPPYTPMWGEYDRVELMMEAARRHLKSVVTAKPGEVLADASAHWQIGDVLLFRARPGAVAKHCGIVSGTNVMVHSYSGIGVVETGIGIWGSRVAGVFRFPDL